MSTKTSTQRAPATRAAVSNAKPPATSTAVAERKPAAVAVYDYGEAAGTGFEDVKSSDLSIPFLQVLQSNSPQVEDDNPEGSRPGMLYNTVTRELSQLCNFLPVHTQDAFVEWVPRNKGGGFVAVYEPADPIVVAAIGPTGRSSGKIELPNGNELVQTHYVYGLILDDDGKASQGFAVLGFTSTKIKVYRDWRTSMYMVKGKPPIFAFRARITTVKQQNDKGTFFNFSVDPLGKTWVDSLINPAVDGSLLDDAQEFRKLVTSGAARAAYETQVPEGSEAPAGKPAF